MIQSRINLPKYFTLSLQFSILYLTIISYYKDEKQIANNDVLFLNDAVFHNKDLPSVFVD